MTPLDALEWITVEIRIKSVRYASATAATMLSFSGDEA